VADTVEHLTVFQRTAQWIIPNPIYHQAVPEGDRWALRHLPFYGRWYRFIVSFPGIGAGMEPFRIDPSHDDPTGLSVNPGLAQRAEALVASIESIVDDPELLEKVVPDYPAVGKRILQDDGTWLRTLLRPDVELVRTAVDHIEPDGVVTVDGVHHAADVLCLATGFRHNDFLATLAVTGRDGLTLRELWGDEPTAYLGITVAGFPNLFCVYGPGTNLAAGAGLFYHSEFQVHYAMDAIHETLVREATSCEVTRDAYEEYARRHQDEISQMVWAHPSIEHSHYKNPQGRVFTLSPWPLDAYWSWTRRVDTDHYTFR
jgi:4-hydroxyacetophenone monooxygenase